MTMPELVRTEGGFEETLELPTRGVKTTRGTPFTVTSDEHAVLRGDPRFREPRASRKGGDA